MAAYNSEKTIGDAITSFIEQTYPSKELIVVDGGSVDSTCDIVRGFNYPHIHLYSEPDNGIYDAMNKGLRRVTGEFFGCLNSDDCFARPDSLELIVDALESTDLVSGRLHFVREHDGSWPVRIWQPTPYVSGAYRRGFSLPHPTTYARRIVLERVGEFCTEYRSAGDYDWLMRALELEGFSHSVIQDVIVNMRIGGESTAGFRSIMQNSRELLSIRRRRLGGGPIDAAIFINLFTKMKQRLSR